MPRPVPRAGDDGGVDVLASLEAPCDPDRLFAEVEDLSRYPGWLNIVTRSEREPGADPAAWAVDLRGRVGRLARSKRLRMVRTVHDSPHRVRFERHERSGRGTSPWVLDADIEDAEHGSVLTMRLHYGGSFGVGLLERMLADEIEASRPRLLARVAPVERS